jgi:hypothetical protein
MYYNKNKWNWIEGEADEVQIRRWNWFLASWKESKWIRLETDEQIGTQSPQSLV